MCRKRSRARAGFSAALALGVLAAAPLAAAGQRLPSPEASPEPSQLRPDLESRLRIARADAAWSDTRKAAEEMVQLAADLSERVSRDGRLESGDSKTLEKIRKLAKRVRENLG